VIKRITVTFIIILLIASAFVAYHRFRSAKIDGFISHLQTLAEVVSTQKAETETWPGEIDAVGTLKAVNRVDISPEIAGIVKQLHFASGQLVEIGTPLVTLDDELDKADLANHKATLKLKQMTYQRQKDLLSKGATSSAMVDASIAELRQAEAAVSKTDSLISKKTIRAPFKGKLGIRKVNLGEYVTPGSSDLVNLQSLTPLHVLFNLPEQHLHDLFVNQTIEVTTDSTALGTLLGTITAIDSKIDDQTRNILVQATISNEDLALYPGMFVNIKVLLPENHQWVTVPQTAISYSLHGDSVFVVKEEKAKNSNKTTLKTYRKMVTTGLRKNNKVAITKGLQAGEQVVTAGQIKLRNGSSVEINNTISL